MNHLVCMVGVNGRGSELHKLLILCCFTFNSPPRIGWCLQAVTGA